MQSAGNTSFAHEILRQAHERAYHWPADFAGFRATLQFADERNTYVGTIVMISPQDIRIKINVEDDNLQWLRHEIASLCSHRWHAPYEAGDGRYNLRLILDKKHPLGYLIQFTDDPFQSSYRLKDNLIARISRRMGDTRFTIFVQEHTFTEQNQSLPHHYSVVFWDAIDHCQVRTDIYNDEYTCLSGLYLPTRRLVITTNDEGATVRQLEFSRHELLMSRTELERQQQQSMPV